MSFRSNVVPQQRLKHAQRTGLNHLRRTFVETEDEEDDDDASSVDEEEEERILSRRRHGNGARDDGENMNGKKRQQKTEEEIADEYKKEDRKKTRRPRPKLEETHLMGTKGLNLVMTRFPKMFGNKKYTKRNMARFSKHLVEAYQQWLDDLVPGVPLEEQMIKLQTFNSKTAIKHHLQGMRTTVRNRHVENVYGQEQGRALLAQLEIGLLEAQQQNSVENNEAGTPYIGRGGLEESVAKDETTAVANDVTNADNQSDGMDRTENGQQNRSKTMSDESNNVRTMPRISLVNRRKRVVEDSSDEEELTFEDDDDTNRHGSSKNGGDSINDVEPRVHTKTITSSPSSKKRRTIVDDDEDANNDDDVEMEMERSNDSDNDKKHSNDTKSIVSHDYDDDDANDHSSTIIKEQKDVVVQNNHDNKSENENVDNDLSMSNDTKEVVERSEKQQLVDNKNNDDDDREDEKKQPTDAKDTFNKADERSDHVVAGTEEKGSPIDDSSCPTHDDEEKADQEDHDEKQQDSLEETNGTSTLEVTAKETSSIVEADPKNVETMSMTREESETVVQVLAEEEEEKEKKAEPVMISDQDAARLLLQMPQN